MIVMKFGGTSVGDAQRMRSSAAIVFERRDRLPIVIVSALGGVTDTLLAVAESARNGNKEGVEQQLRAIRERHQELISALGLPGESQSGLMDSLEPELARLEEVVRGVLLLGECTSRSRDAIARIRDEYRRHRERV